MLSNSSKYALKAVLFLAVHSYRGHNILAKNISGPTQVPKAYLAKILQDLSRHNIVSSVRGPGGGFYLSEANRAVPLIKIIHTMDGNDRLMSCMLSLNECDAEHPCPLHDLVGDTKTRFVKKLEETTINDLIADIEAGKSFLPM